MGGGVLPPVHSLFGGRPEKGVPGEKPRRGEERHTRCFGGRQNLHGVWAGGGEERCRQVPE